MVDAQRNEFQPDYLVQPCDVRCYELEQRGMNQRELARRTGLSPKHIVDLVKGKSRITPETAIKLERSIGMPVDYWLTLEAHYQEALARHQEEESLDNQLEWLQRVPVKSMVKLRWIKPFPDKREQLKELLQFFSIASVDQWGDVWRDLPVAYRQYNKHEVFPEAVPPG
jgi:addiction module HigA family antidote